MSTGPIDKQFFQRHKVRIGAITALIIVCGVMWWYGKHPRSASPPGPAPAYHYPMTQPVPIGSPYPATPQNTFYTIQLMGSHQHADAMRFVAEHRLHDVATIYQETYQNKPWFIVGYGRYHSRQFAEKMLPTLKSQHLYSGWVRPMHDKVLYVPLAN